MNNWKKIKATELSKTPFELIGTDWMLVTAGDREQTNTMTASWGGLGIMWGMEVAFIVIRPQRYTKQFLDKKERFSLSFYEEKYRPTLAYLGKVSGCKEDKITASNLHLSFEWEVPFFEEANLVLFCKKLFAQEWKKDSFFDISILSKWYPDSDLHTLYIAQIEKILKKE